MGRQKAADSCARILNEAEHLIHIQGYHCTSLEDIADRCEMTKANLLHHFRSKEDLVLAVLDYKMQLYRENCWAAFFAEGSDPIEAVSRLFQTSEQFYRGNGCKAGCFVANMALEMSDISPRFRERTGQFFEDCVAQIERMLEKSRGARRFSPALKPRACAEAIVALYEGAIMLARTRRDPEIFQRIERTAVDLLKSYRQKKSNAVNLSASGA